MAKHGGLRAALRRAIYARDDGLCGFCGKFVEFIDLDIDHVVPRVWGGRSTKDNLRVAHAFCNRRAGGGLRRHHRPIDKAPPSSLEPLVALVARLQRENVELAGLVGHLQERVATLERALPEPTSNLRHPGASPDNAADETTQKASAAPDGRSWWRFWVR